MQNISNEEKILIKVNGENKIIPLNISILELINEFKLNKDRVVIELNRKIIKNTNYENIHLTKNDELEIITFVGGG